MVYKFKHNHKWTCKTLQKVAFPKGDANSFKPRNDPKKEKRSDGVWIKTEIKFGDDFPNSYLDISYPNCDKWQNENDIDDSLPTFVYWHGGGHIFGDKNMGDPLSPDHDISADLYDGFCKAGFNFVNVNYAFATEYIYPSQILQYNQALDYLNKHSKELHLNMNNVVIGGSSGGAVYTSQWAMILTNNDYRNKFNEVVKEMAEKNPDKKYYNQILNPGLNIYQVKALMLEVPPMIIDGMNSNTQILYKCWFDTKSIPDYEPAKLTHIADYVTKDYIPCFITAGNTDCYPEDAKELHEKLDKIGVENSYFYVEKKVEILKHGYMSSFKTSVNAKKAFDQCILFLKSKTGIK